MLKLEKRMRDDVRKMIFIQWESEYVDDEDKGTFNSYEHNKQSLKKTS